VVTDLVLVFVVVVVTDLVFVWWWWRRIGILRGSVAWSFPVPAVELEVVLVSGASAKC
jgi:hypothetical protein